MERVVVDEAAAAFSAEEGVEGVAEEGVECLDFAMVDDGFGVWVCG